MLPRSRKRYPNSSDSYWAQRRRIKRKVNEHLQAISESESAQGTERLGLDESVQDEEQDLSDFGSLECSSSWDCGRSGNDHAAPALGQTVHEMESVSSQSQPFIPDPNLAEVDGALATYSNRVLDSESDASTSTTNTDSDTSDVDLGDDSVRSSDLSLKHCLSESAVEKNVSHSALSSLLKILHPHHPELPMDPRTLLATQTQYAIHEVSGGN